MMSSASLKTNLCDYFNDYEERDETMFWINSFFVIADIHSICSFDCKEYFPLVKIEVI